MDTKDHRAPRPGGRAASGGRDACHPERDRTGSRPGEQGRACRAAFARASAILCGLEAPGPTLVRLLTFNCLWRGDAEARLAVLGGRLERSDVDVACLQEVVLRRRVALLRSAAPRLGRVAHRQFGIAVMGGLVTLSRWPIVRQRYAVFRSRGRWWNAGRTDRLIRKGFLLTELDAEGRHLVVVNTHLLANYDGDWSPGNDYARLEHAELTQLAEAVAAVDAVLPLVVAGDLNVPSGTWLFDDFLRRSGLRDAFPRGGEPTCRPAPPGGSRYDIDHVLVRGPVDVSAELRFRERAALADGRRVPLSDHLGIAAALTLRSEEPGAPAAGEPLAGS